MPTHIFYPDFLNVELWRPRHTPKLGDGVRLLRDGGIVERPLGAQRLGLHLFPRHQCAGWPPGPLVGLSTQYAFIGR